MPTNADDIAHLLRRTGFGASGARIAQLVPLDWAAAVEAVLDTSADPPLDIPPDAFTWRDGDGYPSWERFFHWWLDRCAATPTPIVEKMALFWHGHFTTSYSKVYNLPAIAAQHRLYRTLALGDFRDLTQRMAIEPAMLWYLDNAENVASSPNQNFARELMELFLLGVGNYTEDDVVAAARAWTGYGTPRWDIPEFLFRPEEHDNGLKTFFGTSRNWSGPEIIDEILTNPTKRPIMARFLARKWWEFFAYQNPAQPIVDAIAEAFLASGLSIRAALRTLLNRPEFRSDQAKQGLVRSPIEFAVAALQLSGMSSAEAHPEWWLAGMGQQPFNPPNVSGWRPNAYWVNSAAVGARASFAWYLAWRLSEHGWWADLDQLDPASAVDRGAATFSLSLSAPTRHAIEQWLVTQRASKERWREKITITTLFLLSPEMHLA